MSDKKDDLLKFQNSRVEVTGMLITSADTAASAPGGSAAGAPGGGTAGAPANAPATDVQRVQVQTVRQVESSCR